ncbi:MAG: 30S ribosomal protein S20 [Anaerolineaceae bacterium]
MANIKSQIKRNKQSQAARLRNRVYRGTARTMVRKAQAAVKTAEKVEGAFDETLAAIKALDKAVSKGVIHKNNAARRKARLMAKLNAIEVK